MEPSVLLGDLQVSEPLISLRKQSRKHRRPHSLTHFVRDEVLANFECHMVQVPLLAMDGDRIIRRVGDAIRFVVADDKTFLTMQELHQDLGETRGADPQLIPRSAIALYVLHPSYLNTGKLWACPRAAQKSATYRSPRFLQWQRWCRR